MKQASGQSDKPAIPDLDEEELSVRVTMSQTGQRGWLRLKGWTLEVDPGLIRPAGSGSGVLPLDVLIAVLDGLLSVEDEPISLDAEAVIVLPPRRRLTGGHLMGLIPALLFGLVAFVVTIVALADPRQSDLEMAAIFWVLAVIALAPVLPFLLRGRTTARIILGGTGLLLEFWYRPGSRKHSALDVFFVRLLQLQGQVDPDVVPVALLWKGTPWESLEAPQEGSRHTRWAVIGTIATILIMGTVWLALGLSGRSFLAILGIVAAVDVVLVIRRWRNRAMRRAERLWDRGHHDAATGRLYDLLAKRPEHELAWRMYIEYYVRRGDFAAAFTCCDAMEANGVAIAPHIREAVVRFRDLRETEASPDPAGTE